MAQTATSDSYTPFAPDVESALADILMQHLADGKTPGAVAGVWTSSNRWVGASGSDDLDTGDPMRVEDVFRIGSVTKTFTATVVLQLVDEGALRLEDPLDQFVPGFQYGDQITVRHLLNMTSGIFNFVYDPDFLAALDADPLLPVTTEQEIEISRGYPPDFAPGTQVVYSDINYEILGVIIEQLTGQHVGVEITRRILEPLGLTSTSYPTTPDMPLPYSHGYQGSGDRLIDVTRSNPGVPGAGGAMLSTIADLKTWAKALALGTLVSPALHEQQLQTRRFSNNPSRNIGYGLGIQNIGDFVGHNGGIAGYTSYMFYLPAADATVIAWSNSATDFIGVSFDIWRDIVTLLFPEHLP